jgi:hypothetical protein
MSSNHHKEDFQGARECARYLCNIEFHMALSQFDKACRVPGLNTADLVMNSPPSVLVFQIQSAIALA